MTARRGQHVSLLGLVLGLVVSGCATTRFVAPPEDALSQASVVMERAEEAAALRRSLVADARMSYYGPEGAAKGKMVLLARRPADLHISLLSPTDDVLGVMAVLGERFVSFRRGEDRCYLGESCIENIARFSPIALSTERLNQVLFADPTWLVKGEVQLAWDSSAGAYRLLAEDGLGAKQYIWVRHGTWDVVRNTVFNGDDIESEVRYGDFEALGKVRMAQTISLNIPARKIDLRLAFRGMEMNLETGDSPYAISCPDGVEPTALSCGSGEQQSAPREAP